MLKVLKKYHDTQVGKRTFQVKDEWHGILIGFNQENNPSPWYTQIEK